MAITFISSAFVPSVNATQVGKAATYTILNANLPAAQAGDLIVLILQRRIAATSVGCTASGGGQSWNTSQSLLASNSDRLRVVWCRFNGTWTGDVTVINHDQLVASVLTSYIFHVARPSVPGNIWSVDASIGIEASANNGTLTIPGKTPNFPSSIALAIHFGQTGTASSYNYGAATAGWTNAGGPGGANFLLNPGSSAGPLVNGHISSTAYKIQSSIAGTGNCGRTISTGGEQQVGGIIIFYERPGPRVQIIN
jgi:hypothetical protein